MERYHLRGVFTEGADVEVTVAAAAAVANLPGIPIEAALNTKNKQRMRQCFDRSPSSLTKSAFRKGCFLIFGTS